MSVLVALDMIVGTLLSLTVGLTGAVPLDAGAALDRLTTALPVAAVVLAGVRAVRAAFAGARA
jgi:hypothetical protein